MRTVTLGRDGAVTTTRLGFGTAGLLREPSKRCRFSVLAAALDAGIRHFDTAPLYGLGEAEQLLGEFLACRHEEVTVATKFGLTPSSAAKRLAPVQSVARAVLKAFPALRSAVRRRAHRLHARAFFDVATARASLERSLAALRRDRVELLLLHECAPSGLEDRSLLDHLQELRDLGRIGNFGTATGIEHTLALLESHPAYCNVVQFASDILTQNVRRVGNDSRAGIVTHSVLTPSLGEVSQAIRADADLRRRWSEALGFDVGAEAALSRLFLQAALAANPGGIVLVHSNSPRHIAANAAVLDEPIASAQLAALALLIGERFGR